ncbi:MAG: hydantoinase/oxoprolinase family protein [Actinobacteria bacterium]|nr:hydantoinase/oxoprolinase family protein [Actinomycetota bacterium]
MSFRLGIDVGGTFTDFLLVGDDDFRLVHKTSSTPDDPSVGFVTGLEEMGRQLGGDARALLAQTEVIVHGTTVTTNAVLTHRGSKTGLLGTKGFRDTLALRYGLREASYDNRIQPPVPLVPRYRRIGVPGRVDYAGTEVTPLGEGAVRHACAAFAREDVEAVAICFMHSPANPAHEQRTRDLVRELLPGAYVTASSDLLPQVRYYDRTSTTVLNAYVGPIITRYLQALTRRLADLDFGGVLLIMQSNGGVGAPAEVAERAALSLLSGPASGPTAGLWQLAPHGVHDCITIDMGGTSFDAALVKDGVPLVMTDGLVDRWRIALPMIDIHTIGAGGGSIARVDDGGMLQVGPQSAGAKPGPVCYGRGGTEPTTTDADLVLGYLDPRSFLRGEMPLDRDAAAQAIEERIAKPLGISVQEAAAGIYDVINVAMATGVRDISVRRGLDPRDFPLVVAGGAGPVHAAAIASELEIPLLVVPRESSIFCAAGMLMCDFKHDFVRSLKASLAEIDPSHLSGLLAEMEAEGRAILDRERVPAERISTHAALDLRYVGQWHELTVPIADVALDAIAAAFHAQHDLLFGYQSPEMPIEVLAVRLSAVGSTRKPEQRPLAADGGDPGRAELGVRAVWSRAERRLVETRVLDGLALATGGIVEGPAVIELANTTIVLPEEFDLAVDRFGAFVLWTGDRGRELAAQLAPEALGA